MHALPFLPVILLAFGPAPQPPCPMTPESAEIRLTATDPPRNISSEGWTRRSAGAFDLLVNAEGPEGSGRYWTVSVCTADKGQKRPLRGTSLETSTVGWRTLFNFKDAPLPWIDDVDADGKAELILWNSFPLHEEASMAAFGLVAWVYRPVSADKLVIDWKLSRKMAREIAESYRMPAKGAFSDLRAQAAQALQAFADGQCKPSVQPAR